MQLQLREILKLEPQLRGLLADSSVWFVKFMPPDNKDFELAGSGTLIACGNVRGILTADHVLQNLPRSGEVGIVPTTSLESRVNRLSLNVEYASKITVGKCPNSSIGPDLGVLVLPQPIVARLESLGKPFYNLSTRRNRMLDMNLRKPGLWIFSGMVNEWSADLPPYRQFNKVKVFRGANVLFNLATVREDGGFDFLSLKLACGMDGRMPKSFQGCSGGGIWQILLAAEQKEPKIEELLLSGVAFYETHVNEVVTEIECHGIKSIYEHVIQSLADVKD
jgi:hypothetical protein